MAAEASDASNKSDTMDEMDEEETLIEQLQNLNDYTNIMQLEILLKEIEYMFMNKIEASEEWYEERIDKVYEYNNLNWEEMYLQFKNKDDYMHYSSAQIKEMTDFLINQWTAESVFDLVTYKTALYYTYNIWKYYESCFLGKETDGNMIDLIESMMHL